MESYLDAVNKYAVFDGRASRQDFWMFALVVAGLTLALSAVDAVAGLLGDPGIWGMLGPLYLAAMVVPWLAVGARRLHDTGRSGWWLLLAIVPLGIIVLIFMWTDDGEPGTNSYGADPLDRPGATATPRPAIRVGGRY